MNDELREALRHGDWATRKLLEHCSQLSEEQRTQPGPGVGSLVDIIRHVVRSEAAYVGFLGGPRPEGVGDEGDGADLAAIERHSRANLDGWERLLDEPLDPERRLVLDDGKYDCAAVVVIVQALHHGAAHREQVRARLSEFGVKPPDLQPWAYALEVGRATWTEQV